MYVLIPDRQTVGRIFESTSSHHLLALSRAPGAFTHGVGQTADVILHNYKKMP